LKTARAVHIILQGGLREGGEHESKSDR